MTTEISTAMIRELREKTGAGVMDAKRALEQAGGDSAKAEELLLEKGLASAAKRSGRTTTEGVVESYIHSGGRIGAMVQLSCETDFVARTDGFKDLAKNLAMQVAAMSPQFVDREAVPEDAGEVDDQQLLMEQDYIREPGTKISELVKQLAANTGENIVVSRFSRFELGQ
jgi:elongation factor Ts